MTIPAQTTFVKHTNSYTGNDGAPSVAENSQKVVPFDAFRKSLDAGARLHQAVFGRELTVNAYQRCLSRLATALEPNLAPIELLEAISEETNHDELSLANTMAELGYQANVISLSPRDIDPRLLPCLFVPENDQDNPVVILVVDHNTKNGTCVYYRGDDNVVESQSLNESFGEGFGRGHFFRKKSASELSTSKQIRADTDRTWFGATIARFRPLIWQLLAIGMILNIVALATPLFVMTVYDRVISPQDTDIVPMLLVGVSFALLLEMGLRVQRTRLLSWMTARIHYIVGTEVFKRLIELPPSVIKQVSLTAQISRIRSFESVRDFFSGPIFASTIELPSVIVSLTLLVYFSLKLALVPIGAIVIYVALFFSLRHYISIAIRVAATEASIAQRFSTEALQDREAVRANGLVELWKDKIREISGRENSAYARLHFLSSIGEHLAYALTILTGLATLLLGISLVWQHELSTGMLVASMLLVWRTLSPFSNVCSQIARFEQFRNSTRQINKLMEIETEEETRSVTSRIPKLIGEIELQNVAVRVSRDAGPIFHGVNINIKAGEAIGICGSMGTGKTTLLSLIQCMRGASIGKIMIDGLNIQQLEARNLRRQISYIPQAPEAYPGTIAENLRIVVPEASDEVLWDVLDRVGARTSVRAQAFSLCQPIQDCLHDGDLLFRLAFARIILQRSNLILIDEIPSSYLNNGIDKLVTETISTARGRRTVMFVSQRVDHLRMADKVIGLRHGRAPIIGSLDKILEAVE